MLTSNPARVPQRDNRHGFPFPQLDINQLYNCVGIYIHLTSEQHGASVCSPLLPHMVGDLCVTSDPRNLTADSLLWRGGLPPKREQLADAHSVRCVYCVLCSYSKLRETDDKEGVFAVPSCAGTLCVGGPAQLPPVLLRDKQI